MSFRRRGRKQKKDNTQASVLDVEASALRTLAMRDHGSRELRKKLKDKGFPEEHIDAVIDDFIEWNYLNDERVCEGMAQSLARQSWGPIQIRAKLRMKYFNDDLIAQAIESIEDAEEVFIERAKGKIESKFRKEASELDYEEKQKAYRHLSYRGYTGDTIRRVIF